MVIVYREKITIPVNNYGFNLAIELHVRYHIYMTTWESGRESRLLDDIIAGRKTIEGRLNKGKFADYRIGDLIWLRRDYRDKDGILHDGEPHFCQVKIIDIRHYASFLDLTRAEDFKTVIPYVDTAEQAADEYNKFYSPEDQASYGVLAIQIALAPTDE